VEKKSINSRFKKDKELDKIIEAIFGSSPVCCQLWDRDLKIVSFNEACVKLFKITNKQEYAERFFELSPEFQPDGKVSSQEAVRLLKKAFETGFGKFEWMHQTLDGE
jgi:PAS domain-containing protein